MTEFLICSTNRIAKVLLVCLMMILSGSRIWAQGIDKSQTIELAKKEGRLAWYTTMAVDDSKPVLDAFLKEFPFVKAELVRLGGQPLLNRIITEAKAGRSLFDVVASLEIGILVERNLISPYISSESSAFDARVKDPNGYWTGIYNNNLVLTYNSKMVSEKDAPKSYTDLLLPKWKGNILLHPGAYGFYGTLVSAWGRNKTDDYLKQLMRQNVVMRPGWGLIAQLVAAGESPLGFAYNFRAEDMKKNGAPIDWVDTFDPIVTSVTAVGLSVKPPNPNTAKLFVDFILSRKGQEIIRDLGRTPSRADIKPLAPKMDQNKLKLRLVPTEVYLHYDHYAKDYRKLIGL
jgi:iron(III) transport system substrate-binding protein